MIKEPVIPVNVSEAFPTDSPTTTKLGLSSSLPRSYKVSVAVVVTLIERTLTFTDLVAEG